VIFGQESKFYLHLSGSLSFRILNIIKISVLLPKTLSSETRQSKAMEIFIIDWEFAQFGHHAYDLGQICGDLYERKHFSNAVSAIWVIQGVINGYGPVSEEMAFRIAIHTGVHLICWALRRPAIQERAEELVKLAVSFVVKGWEKDRRWFEDSALSSFFKNS
jgi:thiamine kinase-like enzyme